MSECELGAPPVQPDVNAVDVPIDRLLKLVCAQLGMETAFIGRIDGEARVVCHVSGSGNLDVGHSDPAQETYCQLIVDGVVDTVIPDVTEVPRLADLAVTETLGIGSYIGLPLTLSDGTLYGTLCAYGPDANPNLSNEDVRILDLVAAVVADRLEDDVRIERSRAAAKKVVTDLLDAGHPRIVFQPIVDTATRTAIGFEALSRFDTDPYQSPDKWFAAAIESGLGVDLEVQAIRHALEAATELPAGTYVTLNASPELVVSRRLHEVLATHTGREIVVELTEHERADVEDFADALSDLRAAGHRVAMDDVGSGHSGLTRLIALGPDIVKLDRTLISGINTDLARRALVAAAVGFAAVAGGTLLAEGVETAEEAETLLALGVGYAQGYYFGRPAPASDWS